jgi:hypothetical protein
LTSTLADQGPYEFAVSGAGDDYIDLANTYMFVEAQIVDDDDTALDGGCVPLLGLFSLGRSFYSSFSWGSYRVHSFLE